MPLRFADLGAATDRAVFGGKAAGLARLVAEGARVPPGFAVEASTALPDGARDELRARAAELLEDGPVGVRSSAIGEDSAERSFAGMFETVLGVASPDEALDAAARCIASGASDRVLAYAGASSPAPVGVVVQAMVDARAAGVCFTRDPGGRDGAIVLEAVHGLGDALVSGHATPESWRAYRSGFGAWECRVERASGVVSATECAEIAGGAAELAAAFGHPLDLEWAIAADGTLFWLQARPITACVDPPSWVVERAFPDADDGPVSVWSNWNVRETMPDPLRPLSWTIWRDVLLTMLVRQAFGVSPSSPLREHMAGLDLVHGRLYFNMNMMLAAPLFGPAMRPLLKIMDQRAGAVLEQLIADGVLRPRRIPGSRVRVIPSMAIAGLRSSARFTASLSPERALRSLEEAAEAIRLRPDVAGLSDERLVDEFQLWLRPECARLRDGLQAQVVAIAVYGLAVRAFRRHPAAKRLLTTGITANPTTQISLGLDDLVEAARPVAHVFLAHADTAGTLEALEREPAGEAWLARFRDFLVRVGHRGPMEFDVGATRWSEDPTMLVDIVRAGLRTVDRETMRDRMARLAGERQRAVDEAAAASPAWKRPAMRRLARAVERYMPLREAPKHYGIVVFARMRAAALELGRRLVARGLLDAADDVFFLELPELAARDGRDRRALVAERRARYERFRAERAPDFVRSDGVPVVEAAADVAGEDGVLRGAAISPGRAEGPVRVLREPDPRLMADGDVIVLEFADPGWTPLFPRAAAVVMEIGGLMCHAAVVAREMGVPAVFGVSDATRLLADGERVTVDGDCGTVVRSSVWTRD